jgi:hypothetical protein
MKGLQKVTLAVMVALLACGPLSAQVLYVPQGAPALIIAPDYPDSYHTPKAAKGAVSLSPHVFVSPEGYLFSYDTLGRRNYYVPQSYVVAPVHLTAPVPMGYILTPALAPVVFILP